MYYPQIQNNTNTRSLIDEWRGYNHNYRVNSGEFYDMENMTSDAYPVLMPRKKREMLVKAKYEITGILYSGGALAFLDGYIFHYSDWTLNLSKLITGEATEVTSDDDTVDEDKVESIWVEQNLLRFGAYILIFPLNIWVKVDDDASKRSAGLMGARVLSDKNVTVTYSMSDLDGADMNIRFVSSEEPTEPNTGDYWLNTLEGEEGLLRYYNSSWNPVATTYIKIQVPGMHYTDYFEVGDAVNLNNNIIDVEGVAHDCLTLINNGSVIQAVGDDYIIVIGILDRAEPYTQTTSENWRLTVERTIPVLDYVCVNENRVWGCRYGFNSEDKHTLVNEIYCSKLGDFKNWNVYQGLSTDAYVVTVGEPGAWTGCISFKGSPLFFKENMVFKMYGSFPSEFTLASDDIRGVQSGSHKSLCIVGEYLYYKAPTGVMAYDGSTPVLISSNLGRDTYYFDGVAGASGDKYYIELSENNGIRHYLFVYDSQVGIWSKESHIGVHHFANSRDGVLFAATRNAIWGIGRKDDIIYSKKMALDIPEDAFYTEKILPGEEYVQWYCETGDMGYEYPDYKYVDKITIRAYVEHKSEIQIQISYDDGKYEDVGILRGFAETKSQSIDIMPFRCDHFRLKFIGHGDVRIYSMALTLDTGSEEYEYNKN